MASLSILYICIGNTCRSPMAEAITRGLAGADVTAFSAGLMPFGRIVSSTTDTLNSMGYDSSGLASKGLDDIGRDEFDIVVSLLGDSGLNHLPSTLGVRFESWSIRDPYGEDDEVYLAVARELERRIGNLLDNQKDRELPIV